MWIRENRRWCWRCCGYRRCCCFFILSFISMYKGNKSKTICEIERKHREKRVIFKKCELLLSNLIVGERKKKKVGRVKWFLFSYKNRTENPNECSLSLYCWGNIGRISLVWMKESERERKRWIEGIFRVCLLLLLFYLFDCI